MNPWDPILESVPGGEVPVAPPIRVQIAEDDHEALWWGHLLAALWGLRTVYHRLKDDPQVYRTGKVQAQALAAVQRVYRERRASTIWRLAQAAASTQVNLWDWRADPLALEAAWWAQAARCAHVLAQGYAYDGGLDDLGAVLSADVLRSIRERVGCALPPTVAEELLALATAPALIVSRAEAPSRGTPCDPPPTPPPTMEYEG